MKSAYFDCQAGIAGNMILGALIDTGLSIQKLTTELNKLPITKNQLPNNYQLSITKIRQNNITGTLAEVKIKGKEPHRNLKDIVIIINKSELSKAIKQRSIAIFKKLAEAEAKVHGVSIDNIHFHEVGAVDAIIDIVGTVIALDLLGIEEVYSSAIPNGKGWIKHAHGMLPIPAPATAELLKGIPTYQTNIEGELVTPTGAAIITSICDSFEEMPRIKVQAIGYGQGTKDYGIPNFLRVVIGEIDSTYQEDAILQIETNIDDMDPEKYHQIIKKLMKAGVLDVSIAPILMKKRREAQNLIVLCNLEDKQAILDTLFTFTSTIGVRIYLVKREKLPRRIVKVKTKWGTVRVKVSFAGKTVNNIMPEFEDCRKAAIKHKIPIREVFKTTLQNQITI
ncbi:MAG: nickel pincer cofactor biosynthesis protein LarC [Candidatus Saganbacteria bacterium]|nr:nickel pincer cofactor biosynthesis protein LarC [Candidatus Saganbacteria bacterium]